MAISAIRDIERLDEGLVLAPERYDPRRRLGDAGPRLGDFVVVRRDQVSARSADGRSYLVLDTGDAQNGIVTTARVPSAATHLRSAKKRIEAGQVIISRLRPYLRQVAWIDSGILAGHSPDVELVGSTEFYVLNSRDRTSIAFLAPFLLSSPVQAVLAAAQEGGHHPRFNEQTLRTLPLPELLVERRAELSTRFEEAVEGARAAYVAIERCVLDARCERAEW